MADPGQLSRRNFIQLAVRAGSGLILSVHLPVCAGASVESGRTPVTFAPNAFLQISGDNTIRIILSKVEMGQGIWTTLPMLIAEELDCDWSRIIVQHRGPGYGDDFLESPYVQSTGGSDSTRSEFDRWRMAGAVARTMLVQAAARQWNVSPGSCTTKDSFVLHGSQRLSYGELSREASLETIPDIALRPPEKWRIIGQSKARLDTPEKINGGAVYGMDVRLDGMLTAVSAHPPVFGAAVKTFDASTTTAVKGVRDVVQTTAGLAVVADHFWAAKTGRDLLRIEWTGPPAAIVDSRELAAFYARLGADRGNVAVAKDDPYTVLSAASTLEAEVVFPYLAHAPMEPLNCTVNITPGRCEIWCGTQWPLLHQKRVAAMLGLSPEQVVFNTPHLGGSFGRRGSFYSEWIIEAVEIAKAAGRPVKFVWTREDDIRRGYYRPAYLHHVKIGIDAAGYPNAWVHRVVGQSLFTGTPLEPDIVTGGIDWSSLGGVVGSPYLSAIPHSVELHTTSMDVPVLPWRSVSHTHTAFVMETLIDELAFRASVDPLEYRRRLLANHPRHLAALNLAAEKAGWAHPPPKGRFRGLAVHGAMESYVAEVVEVSVDNGKIKVHRVVCAVDCGPVVNPDGIRAQMEGGIVYGLTAALYGEISITRGEADQSNFHDYRMLRMNECPHISVHIVQGSGSMGGVGEPGVPPIAPAVANALFAATGRRFRSLPLKI